MRKIIYVWNYRDWGGAQVFFMSLMKEAKKNFAVTALIPEDSEPKILQYLNLIGVPVEFLSPAPVFDKNTGLLGKIRQRITILRSENGLVDNILARPNISDTIVHIDLGFWQSFLSLLRLCSKMHVFVTVHTGLPFCTGWRGIRWKLKGKIFSRFSSFHLLTSNNDAKESLRPYVSAKKFAQVQVTYSGIDPDEIERVSRNLPQHSEIRQKYGLPENKTLLMTVGQFIERKGCWIVLESLKQLRAEGKDFVFVWLSTILPDAETMKRIDDYGLGNSFRIIGAEEIGQTRDDLLTLLSTADIFVLASLQEGLPIALVEAMALGLPCITTNINAIPEAIEDGKNGTLVSPNDPIRLSKAITALLNDPEQRKILGASAKKTAFEKFNEKVTAARMLKLYRDVWQTTR